MIARLQELVDARPAAGEISLEWAVKAQFLGDVNGLVALALREDA